MNLRIALLFLLSTTYGISQYGIPLNLTLPFDEDTITTKEPVLIWQTDLATLTSQPRNSLDLVVVEMNANQTASEAIAINTPVLYKANLTSTSIAINRNEMEIKPNVWYAWQLKYTVAGTPTQETDVWKFIYVEEEKPKVENGYVVMREFNDGAYYTYRKPIVHFTTQDKGLLQLNIEIIGGKSKMQIDAKELVNDVEQSTTTSRPTSASRYFKLDLTSLNLEPGRYLLNWRFANGKVSTLNIELK